MSTRKKKNSDLTNSMRSNSIGKSNALWYDGRKCMFLLDVSVHS